MPAKVGRFVGYSSNGLLYQIWTGRKLIETRHVTFDEKCFKFSYDEEAQDSVPEMTPWIYVDPILLNPKKKNVSFSSGSQNEPAQPPMSPARVPQNTPRLESSSQVPTMSTVRFTPEAPDPLTSAVRPVPLPLFDDPSSSSSNTQASSTIQQPEEAPQNDNVPSSPEMDEFVDAPENPTVGPPPAKTKHKGLDGRKWNTLPAVDVNGPRLLRSSRPQTQSEGDSVNLVVPSSSSSHLALDSVHYVEDTPKNLRQALTHKEAAGWMAAIQREYASLLEMEVFKEVEISSLPKETQLFDTKFVFTRKPPPVLYKARLCFRGDKDKAELPLSDTFSTVVRTEDLRLLLSLILTLGWKFVLVDISTAFLYARMKRLLYIKVPAYYPRNVNPKKSALLCQGALYGTPDGPKNWSDELSDTLKKMGYSRCHSDWNLFVKKTADGAVSYVAFHVDA
jgi:hypothetical protein